MKLNQRIILITIIPLIISTSVSTIIITEIATWQLFESTIMKVEALSKLMASEMRNPMSNLDIDAINELIDNLEENKDVHQVLVFYPDGRLFTDGTDDDFNYGMIFEDEFVQNALASDKEIVLIENDIIRNSKPIILNEKIGIIILEYSLQSINEIVQNAITKILIVALLIITIASIIAILLSYSIRDPILKIKNNVDNISKGNFENQKIVSKISEIDELAENISLMGEKINNYQKELIKNERLTIVGEMSARITHDLRNPLTAIKNSIEIMNIKNPETAEKNKKYFDMMEDSVLRMSHQIDEVLGFVKIQSTERAYVKFSEMVNNILKTINKPDNIKISSLVKDKEIWCNKIQLENVFINLITNSFQAIGKTEGKIIIDLVEEGNFDKITIEDNGSGIPENSLESIFEPLFTTKQTGTGLGLVSCKNTIEVHGGKIYAQNNPKGGVIFTILLPNLTKSAD